MIDQTELSRLLDERAIIEVTHRYCAALDGRDFSALAQCFTPDAVAVFGRVRGRHEGIEAIQRVCRAALGPLDASQHLVANHLIELDGDTAHSTCYIRAQHTRRGFAGGENYMIAGSYVDDWQRTERGWRIAERHLVESWGEGNPAVVGRPVPEAAS